jgi:uncharacterized protein (TIRG00374 family)
VSQKEQDITRQLNWKKIILPLLLGIGAAAYLLISSLNEERYIRVEDGTGDYEWVDQNGNELPDLGMAEEFILSENGDFALKSSAQVLSELSWTWEMTVFLGLALLTVVIRDLGYMYRIRVLTDYHLSWKKSFDVIMLWEFASALTPSVVGGSGIAIFILNREKINLGRSTATVFVTALMDEMFYIVMVPLLFLFIGTEQLFPGEWAGSAFGTNSIKVLFWIGYGFIIVLTTMIMLSIFSFPFRFKRLMMRLFSIRILKRWRRRVVVLGDEIIISSHELKGQKPSYWMKAFGATFFSWTARFWTLNFIMLIFVDGIDHFVVYGRQLVMWVIMLISPTPGSSGVAEIALSSFFSKDIIPVAYVAIIALIWRLLTYFPYLFVGATILPRWLKRTSRSKMKQSVANS